MLQRLPIRCLPLVLLAATVLATGCVERRFVITATPAGAPANSPDLGAMVFNEKGMPLSASPADSQFIYYGKYRFTFVKDGFQTLVHEENVKAPWYEMFPFDFVSECLIPWTIRDIRRIHVEMQPSQFASPEVLLDQAQILRQKGLGIVPQGTGVPTNAPVVAPSPPTVLPPGGMPPAAQ